MLAEFGFINLLFTLTISFFLVLLPSIALYSKKTTFLKIPLIHYSYIGFYLTYLQAFCSALALILLAISFAHDDFSLAYIASHSNSHLPLFYKIAASWGGHEGSMLFWLFALNLWSAIFAFCHRPCSRIFKLEPKIIIQTLSILGFISFVFCIFLIFFSNPFTRLFPVAFEGSDLNPMLQDIGLIFHPPLLYFGYVGFAICFALTIAMLLQGKFTPTFALLMRPWVLAPWGFLTLGILLGAWWAYYELGWGGWWFWDPVENASLMPWLLALGLLHNLKVNQEKGLFIYWSILFALAIFSFSLLGTFIVRSGALSSVHAFAIDSQRGLALLLLFTTLTMGALIIFSLKARPTDQQYISSFFSKATFTLIANIIFSLATFCVFLGTFYPMFYRSMNWGAISVGAPYFNQLFLPLLMFCVLLMIAIFIPIKKLHPKKFYPKLFPLGCCSLFSFIGSYFFVQWITKITNNTFSFTAYCWLSLAFLLASVSLYKIRPITSKNIPWLISHFAVALAIFGATCSSYFSTEIGVVLTPGEDYQLSHFQLKYQNLNYVIGPNYTSEQSHFILSKNQHKIAELYPEKRHYTIRNMQMSEIGLYSSWLGDIYIVMGDNLRHDKFSFRLYYKPFLIWLWIAGILIALSAFWATLNTIIQPISITNYLIDENKEKIHDK